MSTAADSFQEGGLVIEVRWMKQLGAFLFPGLAVLGSLAAAVGLSLGPPGAPAPGTPQG